MKRLSLLFGIIFIPILLFVTWSTVFSPNNRNSRDKEEVDNQYSRNKVTDDYTLLLDHLQQGNWKYFEGDYSRCLTWLEFGLRNLYCRIKPFITYSKLIEISGLPIFRSGPHSDSELNFNSGYEFGYYNPEFLKWVQENAIDAIINPDDANLKRQIQLAYDDRIKVVARAFYQTHKVLFLSPDEFEVVRKEYALIKETYEQLRQDSIEGKGDGSANILMADGSTKIIRVFGIRFFSELLELEVIKSRYLENIQNKSVTAEDVGDLLQEDCRWLEDYLATLNENSYERSDERENYLYLANVSAAFWVRRSIDGTEKQFFDILTKVLETYDSYWLSKQELLDIRECLYFCVSRF